MSEPNDHISLVTSIALSRNVESYLEIGVSKHATFDKVVCRHKVGVDPDPMSYPTYCMTSDEFFSRYHGRFDLCFVDGFHEYRQSWRDIVNCLIHLNPGGVLVVHDINPCSSEEAEPHDTPYVPVGGWTGDVWKAWVRARLTLPFYSVCYPYDHGCGVIDTSLPRLENASPGPEISELQNLSYLELKEHPDWIGLR